jgi:hypothetical protein
LWRPVKPTLLMPSNALWKLRRMWFNNCSSIFIFQTWAFDHSLVLSCPSAWYLETLCVVIIRDDLTEDVKQPCLLFP